MAYQSSRRYLHNFGLDCVLLCDLIVIRMNIDLTTRLIAEVMLWLLLIPPGVSLIAMDIAHEEIFSSITAWIDANYRGTKFAYLVRCPKCLSHWVAAFFILTATPSLLSSTSLVWADIFIKLALWLATTRVALLWIK